MAAAVMQHLGPDLRSGHNVTVVRQTAHPESEWWKCDNEDVSAVPCTEVTKNAVAILYRRVPSPS